MQSHNGRIGANDLCRVAPHPPSYRPDVQLLAAGCSPLPLDTAGLCTSTAPTPFLGSPGSTRSRSPTAGSFHIHGTLFSSCRDPKGVCIRHDGHTLTTGRPPSSCRIACVETIPRALQHTAPSSVPSPLSRGSTRNIGKRYRCLATLSSGPACPSSFSVRAHTGVTRHALRCSTRSSDDVLFRDL
jgi:hypothetical protein